MGRTRGRSASNSEKDTLVAMIEQIDLSYACMYHNDTAVRSSLYTAHRPIEKTPRTSSDLDMTC